MSAGDSVPRRYEILEEIGSGGMATIFRAKDLHTLQDVALKRLEIAAEDRMAAEATASFEREFNVLAQLSHPHVVQAYDYGVEAGKPFYTMELLDGGDLREHAPLPWQQLCAIAYDVCSALALVHSRRIVHRDLSPRNIRWTKDGRAKLIDFGASAPMGAGGLIVGTPQVLAPEVLQHANLDARTDLFSLGATLYFALTRCLPYPIRGFANLTEAWALKPRAPSSHVGGIPDRLDALLLSMLSIDPGRRPRSAFEVMHRLATLIGKEGRPSL